MGLDTSDPRVVFAIDALRRGCELSRTVQENAGDLGLTKSDSSPVTVADFAVQALVARALMLSFPGAVLVGEESSEALRQADSKPVLDAVTRVVRGMHADATGEQICEWIDAGRGEPGDAFWTLDPIDGTKGFLRREQYAIALAYIENGAVEFGALGCPNLSLNGGAGALLIAARGQGCYRISHSGEPHRLSVSAVADPAQTRLLRSVEAGHTNVTQIDEIARHLRIGADPVPMDSQAKYAALAAGMGDAILRLLSPKRLDYKECIWDQAAGAIVVEEAGGKVTDLTGNALDFGCGRYLLSNTGVCVSNGRLHDALLEAVAATDPV